MARKWHTFHRAVESFFLRLIHLWVGLFRRSGYRLLVLLVLGIFLSARISPVLSQMPVNQSQKAAEELVQEGKNYYTNGQVSEAVNSLQRALDKFKAREDWNNLAITSTNLSRIFQELGQYTRACNTLIQAQELDSDFCQNRELTSKDLKKGRKLPDLIQVSIWRSLGDVLRAIGRLKDSETVLQEALNLADELADEPNAKAATLLSLGNTYRAQGNLIRDRVAEPKYEYMPWRCEEITRPAKDEALEAQYKKADEEYKKADEKYSQVIANNESIQERLRIKAKLNRLSLLLERGKWQEANDLSSEINIKDLPPGQSRVYARINYAKSLACLQQKYPQAHHSWADITDQIHAAIEESKNLERERELEDSRHLLSYAIGNLGGLYEYLEQVQPKPQVTEFVEELCQKEQEFSKKALCLTQEALYRAQPRKAPDIAYQWQWQQGRLFKAEGDNEKAIASYEAAVETLKSVRGDLLAINSEVNFSFRDNVEPVYRELVNLLLEEEEPVQKNLNAARGFIQQLKVAELENFLRCSLQERKSVPIDEIIDRKDSTEAVIYPIIFENHIEIIYKLPHQETLKYRRIEISRSEVDRVLKSLRQNLPEPDTIRAVERDAQQIYSWLISPIKSDLDPDKVKTLVFVLDTPLLSIPMAVLYDGEHYLIENYAIAVTNALQLQTPQTLKPRNLKAILAGLTEARQGFPSLKNVKAQFTTIKSEIYSEVLLDRDFTVNSLQNKVKSLDFPIVHVASHGQFSSQSQETFILAWNDRFDANGLSDLLRSREQTRPEPIDILVLVACETAKGDKWAALGLAGVAVQSGARSTLATLWKVRADESPGDLMSQFYRELKDRNVTKAEALQRAQREFLKDSNRKLPYYWAPYVLIENWL